ncbi:USO1 [Branchiostoma lanceolatum]|uniref:USO1 protein n=1 Tax=Branchiostoma lanceolatum TaxID=7740 RepID=A0A8J9Z4Y7_BRALA|nr:USO1 [Branchiostoma lanceolatum]
MPGAGWPRQSRMRQEGGPAFQKAVLWQKQEKSGGKHELSEELPGDSAGDAADRRRNGGRGAEYGRVAKHASWKFDVSCDEIFRWYFGGTGFAQHSGEQLGQVAVQSVWQVVQTQVPHGQIERLCDRVQSSTLLDDRRDAVRALKALSKQKFRLEVGTQGMDILINVLETDRTDGEIVNYALDTMNNIMCNNPEDDDEEDGPQTNGEVRQEPEDLGGQFTEIFIKKLENVQLLLNFLEEYDFRVRWPTVKLMTTLLCNRCSQMQQIILNSPVGGCSQMQQIILNSPVGGYTADLLSCNSCCNMCCTWL